MKSCITSSDGELISSLSVCVCVVCVWCVCVVRACVHVCEICGRSDRKAGKQT